MDVRTDTPGLVCTRVCLHPGVSASPLKEPFAPFQSNAFPNLRLPYLTCQFSIFQNAIEIQLHGAPNSLSKNPSPKNDADLPFVNAYPQVREGTAATTTSELHTGAWKVQQYAKLYILQSKYWLWNMTDCFLKTYGFIFSWARSKFLMKIRARLK